MRNYGICYGDTLEQLIDEVNKMVEKVYIPQGGPVCVDGRWCQAMFKKQAAAKRSCQAEYTPEFEQAWSEYPKRAGSNPKKKAFQAWSARVKEDAYAKEPMFDGIIRYREFIQATGKMNTEYVMMAATFFGPDKHYENDWAPPEPEKSPDMLPARNEELLAWAKANGHQEPGPGMSWVEYRATLANLVKQS